MSTPQPNNLTPANSPAPANDFDEIQERLGHKPSFETKLQFIQAQRALQALSAAADAGDLSPDDEAKLQVLEDRLAQFGDEQHLADLAADSEAFAQQLGVEIEQTAEHTDLGPSLTDGFLGNY